MSKIKLLTFYSDSHEKMYNYYFKKSFDEYLTESFNLIPKKIEQISPTGEYGSEGFSHAMLEKINHIIDNININENEILVFADSDVQFFDDFSNVIRKELSNYDIKFQSDVSCVCAGFFVCHQNEVVYNFFKKVKEILISVMERKIDDQQVINSIIKQYPIKYSTLSNKFFTVAMATGPKQWNGEKFNVPEDILVHHANWTLGLENKYKLLEYIKNEII
jgi:hypothetical protein